MIRDLSKRKRLGFSLLSLSDFISHVFTRLLLGELSSSVVSSSTELSPFLSAVACEGAPRYRHAVITQRGGQRRSTLWNDRISCADCQTLIWINLFYCSFPSIPPFNCCFGFVPLRSALWMLLIQTVPLAHCCQIFQRYSEATSIPVRLEGYLGLRWIATCI